MNRRDLVAGVAALAAALAAVAVQPAVSETDEKYYTAISYPIEIDFGK